MDNNYINSRNFVRSEVAAGMLDGVGNTPLISLKISEQPNVNLFVKLEASNPNGSVKDRAAHYILKELLTSGTITAQTTIIESTSGNFGVALAAYCKHYGLKFIAVVDPNITAMNEMLIRFHGAQIVKVTVPDANGGYLLTRIAKAKELETQIADSYWVNQYENPLNARSYYETLGNELVWQMRHIDYLFLGVSSGGTITGVSQKVKESFPDAKVVAVDVEGSVIFNGKPKRRLIPGIGSSIVPNILQKAVIDQVVIIDEISTISECHELLEKHSCFVGGSSGSVMAGIKKFFIDNPVAKPVNVVTIFPDRGERYFDTIYNRAWSDKVIEANGRKSRKPSPFDWTTTSPV